MSELTKAIYAVVVVPICLGVMALTWYVVMRDTNFSLYPSLSFALLMLPVFLPFALFYLTYDRWQEFVWLKQKHKNGRTTLRIKLPPEVFKSPQAMETVLAQVHNTSKADNFMEAYIDGKHPLWNSFEIVSIGGEVRFYANVPTKKIKNLLESQLYAQYPGIEVYEEPVDYLAEIQWDPEKMALMSFHQVKTEEEVIPIKTYVDYKLDQMPKEEEKVDPIAPMIEFLSSTVRPHERVVYQILCEPHVKKEFKLGTSLRMKPKWTVAAKKKINEILQRDEDRNSLRNEDENESRPMLTMGERDMVSAIERNTGKLAYVVGIRTMYVTLDKDNFNPDIIAPLLKSFYPYDDEYRNSIGVRWKTDFDYMMFEDFTGQKKIGRMKKELLHAKLRAYDPGTGSKNDIHQPTVMSVEEIATMFHIPGRVVLTPTLERVPATVGNAPSNLPVGSDLPQHLQT